MRDEILMNVVETHTSEAGQSFGQMQRKYWKQHFRLTQYVLFIAKQSVPDLRLVTHMEGHSSMEILLTSTKTLFLSCHLRLCLLIKKKKKVLQYLVGPNLPLMLSDAFYEVWFLSLYIRKLLSHIWTTSSKLNIREMFYLGCELLFLFLLVQLHHPRSPG